MTSSTDPATLVLTGSLPAAIILGAMIALPAALFLLHRYRQAVRRGMRAAAGASDEPGAAPDTAPPPEIALGCGASSHLRKTGGGAVGLCLALTALPCDDSRA